jgi:hypothetical protein
MGTRNAQRLLIGKLLAKRPFEKLNRRLENVKNGLRETEFDILFGYNFFGVIPRCK